MVETNEVPVGTRHSFSIELECLIAYIPIEGKDPDEFTSHGLPPLLRIDFGSEVEETAILNRIIDTLDGHGIPATSQIAQPETSANANNMSSPESTDPSKWIVSIASSVNKHFLSGYFWHFLKIRSPVMWSRDDSFGQIQRVVNLLTASFRFRVNPTCTFAVSVGNGTKLFTAATIKRIGAFLWAGDPLFSRIHAPWRRVHDGSRSIRLDSNLAHGATAKEASEKCEDERSKGVDTTSVASVSDTSREEKEYGSKERLEEFAQWRSEVGPFLTLNEDVNDDGSHHAASDRSSNEDDSSDKGDDNETNEESSSDDDDEWWLAGGDESEPRLPPLDDVLADGYKELEKDQRIHVPADINTLHRNIGWVFWDKVQNKTLMKWIYEYCAEVHGHFKVHKLEKDEQMTIMLQAQCEILYGHSDIRLLDPDQEYQVLVASERYIAACRSSWDWNEEEEKWELSWRRVGNIVQSPAAHREIKIDAPAVVENFENLAKLTELDNEDSDAGIQYVSPDEYDHARRTNRGIEQLLHDLKDYAQTRDPNFRANLADPKTEDYLPSDHRSTRTSSSFSSSPRSRTEVGEEDPAIQFPPEGMDWVNWAMMLEEIKMVGKIREENMHSPESTTDPSTSSVYSIHVEDLSEESSESAEEIDDQVFEVLDKEWREDIFNYIRGVETPEPQVKLRPHSPDKLGAAYRESINEYVHIAEEEWERIAYPQPLKISKRNQNITAEQGVHEIAACETAVETAELLRRTGLQLNYDFTPYSLNAVEEPTSPTHHPINFREAAGTLDADWISMWARICVGVVRWAQYADTDDYLRVMDRVMDQEELEVERVAKNEPESEDWYDVCNLLEDLGLFAEAGWVWRREQERGPPR
ncbi:hypothetical protein ABKA04_006302 [Annulohypoxylon sp. FPYF3050]